MATAVDSVAFYVNGTSTSSQIVGNSGDGTSKPNVVRYAFTTPSTGASGLSFSKESIGAYSASSSTSEKLRFYITDSATSHTAANSSSTYHGEVAMADPDGDKWFTATGSVSNLVLLPGTTYYLYIFPAYTSFGCWIWNYPDTITVTLSGSTGLVRIDTGSGFITALPYIDNGSKWQIAIPYTDNGSSYKICS